jgi:hypothetical protein
MVQREQGLENERFFRRLNERIRNLHEMWNHDLAGDVADEALDAVCECADIACFAVIVLPLAAFERIREHPRRFIVSPGHEAPDAEIVVERRSDYLVVEKILD